MEKVICNQADNCDEDYMCGGATPHIFQKEECGKCPFVPEQKCIKIEEDKK